MRTGLVGQVPLGERAGSVAGSSPAPAARARGARCRGGHGSSRRGDGQCATKPARWGSRQFPGVGSGGKGESGEKATRRGKKEGKREQRDPDSLIHPGLPAPLRRVNAAWKPVKRSSKLGRRGRAAPAGRTGTAAWALRCVWSTWNARVGAGGIGRMPVGITGWRVLAGWASGRACGCRRAMSTSSVLVRGVVGGGKSVADQPLAGGEFAGAHVEDLGTAAGPARPAARASQEVTSKPWADGREATGWARRSRDDTTAAAAGRGAAAGTAGAAEGERGVDDMANDVLGLC